MLFDALERSTPNDSNHIARDLFRGTMLDLLQCSKCGHKRSSEAPYMDLQVDVADMHTVEQGLQKLTTAEILDGDNMWECEACNAKVRAEKGLILKAESLPDILTLQLRRFSFDYSTMRRVKLCNSIAIPEELDMQPYTEQRNAAAALGPTTMM